MKNQCRWILSKIQAGSGCDSCGSGGTNGFAGQSDAPSPWAAASLLASRWRRDERLSACASALALISASRAAFSWCNENTKKYMYC